MTTRFYTEMDAASLTWINPAEATLFLERGANR